MRCDEPLAYHKLRDDMKRQSLDYGCEKGMEPKVWRRGLANQVNGKASDAVRDQALRHDPKCKSLFSQSPFASRAEPCF